MDGDTIVAVHPALKLTELFLIYSLLYDASQKIANL